MPCQRVQESGASRLLIDVGLDSGGGTGEKSFLNWNGQDLIC